MSKRAPADGWRKGIIALTAAVMFSAASPAGIGTAQDKFPTKPITIYSGYAAGGGTSLVLSILAPVAEKTLKQQIVINQKEGGSGAVSFTMLRQAKPDGYTLAIATSSINIHKFLGTLDFGYEAFEPFIALNFDPGGISVKTDAPWKNLKEFIEHARKNPGKVSVAGSNPGSVTRLQLHLIEQAAGVQFNIISFKGAAGPGVTALAGGHVDAAIATPLETKAMRVAGQVRMLGVMSEQRLSNEPLISTCREQGFDIVSATNRVLLAPKGTPADRIRILHNAFKLAVESPEYAKFVDSQASAKIYMTADQTKDFLAKQDQMFKG
ncbi:MAG: tripartite tricarboxylate transporter substrate binding protein, partial [Desulfobacterales bacterium]|nr:tripartite tricarboxylate transporter substrate binding protein [Desulfobacterales bacterium]